jgi:hypothetical protein
MDLFDSCQVFFNGSEPAVKCTQYVAIKTINFLARHVCVNGVALNGIEKSVKARKVTVEHREHGEL